MSVSGATLCNKIRDLMPDIPSSITADTLNKTCDNPELQGFVQWFCASVGRDNVLLPEQLRLQKQIVKNGEWLKGDELDAALAGATKDCRELEKLATADWKVAAKLSKETKVEREAYSVDTEYVRTLGESLANLKDLETKLEEDTDAEESLLEMESIRLKKLYMDCLGLLEEFDSSHRQFSRDIEDLLDVYYDAAEKRGEPVVWTQLPLDLVVTHLEKHNDCLRVYVSKQFGVNAIQSDDLAFDTFSDDGGRELLEDEKVDELLSCQTMAATSKTDEINARIEESVLATMVKDAADIYNNVGSKIPQSEIQLRIEIAALTAKRDFLEKNVTLFRGAQLEQVVRQYSKMRITQMLINNGRAKLDRRTRRWEKLENLGRLAREKGHGYSHLLSILMDIQLHRLNEIVEFVADARHYIATEYSLSASRCDSMQQQQVEFDAITKTTTTERNVFDGLLTALVADAESKPANLEAAIVKYDKLVEDNDKRLKDLLGVHIDEQLADLATLQDRVMSTYDAEIKQGPTNSFKPTTYELLTRLEESTKNVRVMQKSVNETRAKIKEMSNKTANGGFERDTSLVWQRFLTDPEELQSIYDRAKEKIENHISLKI